MSNVRKFILGIFACIPILIIIYIAFVVHFTNVFVCGTYINGIYCTGFNVEECNELLMADYNCEYIELQDESNVRYRITYEEIDGSVDFSEELNQILRNQNAYLWFMRLVEPEIYTLKPKIVYNDLMLGKVLSESTMFDEYKDKEFDVSIVESEDGYILVDNRKGYLNSNKVHETARYAMENQENFIILAEYGCYEDLEYTDEMKQTIELWEKVDAFQNSCKIVYDMGDVVIPVDASVVCHFIKLDQILMKMHKPLSVAMLILVAFHVVFVIPVVANRSLFVNISGISMVVVLLLLIFLCHTIKQKEKKMWWHRALAIVGAVLMVGHMATYFMDFADYQQKVNGIEIEELDLSKIEDGIYEGEYDAGYIYAKVRVEVQDGRIQSVTLLEHRHERGKAAEVILNDVVEQQKIDVDAVSGATNSSKVMKKAIENAISD